MNNKIYKEATKDAKKYAEAKMSYGEGAGIKRRHVNAEIEKKMENESYKRAFEKALDDINYEKIVKDIKAKNEAKAFSKGVRKGIKKTLAVCGSAVGAFSLYLNNKKEVDEFVNSIAERFKGKTKKGKDLTMRKKEECLKELEEDKRKAEMWLRSQGIEVHYV